MSRIPSTKPPSNNHWLKFKPPPAVRVDDVLYVKLLSKMNNKCVRLMSANKFYDQIDIDHRDPESGFTVIGAVV